MAWKIYGCFVTLLLLVLLVDGNPIAEGHVGKHVLCYFEGVSAVKPQEVRFEPEDLDLNICTHVVYNRALVGEDLRVQPRRKDVDLSEDGGLGLLDRTVALKERKPGLKVLLDLHDWNGVLNQEAMSNNIEALKTFSRNVADFIKTRGFDGVSFYARSNEGFLETVPLLHEELSRSGFILMTFLMPHDPAFKVEYEITADLSRNFDLIVVGSYWLQNEDTSIFSSTTKLERIISDYTASGIPSEKLVVAIPAFCVSMELCDREQNGINSSVCATGNEGMYEPQKMVLYHSEVLRKIANATEEWVVARDEESGGQYGYSKTLQWTSFEDPISVRAKAALVLERNLAGVAIMGINMEDFKGVHTENGKTFPLTRAAYNAFYGET